MNVQVPHVFMKLRVLIPSTVTHVCVQMGSLGIDAKLVILIVSSVIIFAMIVFIIGLQYVMFRIDRLYFNFQK